METSVIAETSGTVKEVLAQAGGLVRAGEMLIELLPQV